MPEFVYTALTKDGQKEVSTIVAANSSAAGHLLKERGLLPTELEEKQTGSILDKLRNISTVSLEEKINFVENLSVMLKAGIAISRALRILVKQTTNVKFKNILADISDQVESGKGLGDAVAKYPSVFTNIFVSMIRVGEMSGNLDKNLEYLSTQMQRDADLRSKVKGAMIYPSVIIGAMCIIGVLLAIYVLPSLMSSFKDSGVPLPLPTQIVMNISDFMSGNSVLVIIGMGVIVGALVAFYRTKTGQRFFDIFILHLYVINTIVRKINLARFSRILSSLLKSNIPIVQSLEVVSDSMGNAMYQELLREAATNVKLGKPLTEALGKNSNLFPVLVVQMLQVGEESGTVEEILSQLAGHYEEEVDTTLQNLSSVIEPLLILVIGGVVGVLAIALIEPIYSISSSIQ